MDKIEKAKELFLKLESFGKCSGDVALRNFEIQSRLSKTRAISC